MAVALALGTGMIIVAALPGRADEVVDADGFVFTATASISPPLSLLPVPASATYTFQPSQSCFSDPLPTTPPSPVPASVPGYIDVVPDDPGNCTSVSGGGTLTDVIACETGMISTSWSITEPSGDTAQVDAGGVVVGGVVIAAATPGNYRDDGAAIGTAAVAGLMLPVSLSGPAPCVSGLALVQLTAVVAAVY